MSFSSLTTLRAESSKSNKERVVRTAVTLLFVFLSLLSPAAARACDPCALYNASRIQNPDAGDFTLAVSEQYTDFDRAGDKGPNSVRDGEQVTDFSTTQLAVSYSATERLGFQLNLPILARRTEKFETYRKSSNSDSGLGDLSLIANYAVVYKREANWTFVTSLFGGVKLPTGDTGVLEDFSTGEEAEGEHHKFRPKHHVIGGVSGGRALAFGTGSYDFISGVNLFTRLDRVLLLSSVQYTLKTEGDFNYEFADDVIFSVVPAYYLYLEDELTVAGGVSFSGEFKGRDHLDGALVDGSGISNLYLGPDVIITAGNGLGAELGMDFRVSNEDVGASVVPDMRFRGSIFYRF